MRPRPSIVLLILLTPLTTAFPQEKCATADLPITVTLRDGRLVRSLNSEHFDGQVNGKTARLQITPDLGPRRILLLLDLSKKLKPAVWKAQLAAASYLIQGARTEDRFALMTFAGQREVIGFDQGRTAVAAKLEAFTKQRPESKTSAVHVLDALAEALQILGTPQFGDCIFALFGGEDTGSSVGLSRLSALFSRNPVRVFGISFGVIYWGTQSTSVGPNGVQAYVDPGNPFVDFVSQTGGVLGLTETTHPWIEYKFNDSQRESLFLNTRRLYGQMVEVYRTTFAVDRGDQPVEWKLQLQEGLKRRLPGVSLFWPKRVPPCVN